MKKAWKLLAIKYLIVIFLGCVAHSLNLLIGDIMKLSWLAIELTITELSYNQTVRIDENISIFKSKNVP
ncbi:hypothetical protein C1646_754461 [Rhizophagus diaphanus]|nr:hypothetical protein C1646_754461 [Rhizophagus diaphanus] [Rhizophagus sp. MUCL 43196]